MLLDDNPMKLAKKNVENDNFVQFRYFSWEYFGILHRSDREDQKYSHNVVK